MATLRALVKSGCRRCEDADAPSARRGGSRACSCRLSSDRASSESLPSTFVTCAALVRRARCATLALARGNAASSATAPASTESSMSIVSTALLFVVVVVVVIAVVVEVIAVDVEVIVVVAVVAVVVVVVAVAVDGVVRDDAATVRAKFGRLNCDTVVTSSGRLPALPLNFDSGRLCTFGANGASVDTNKSDILKF